MLTASKARNPIAGLGVHPAIAAPPALAKVIAVALAIATSIAAVPALAQQTADDGPLPGFEKPSGDPAGNAPKPFDPFAADAVDKVDGAELAPSSSTSDAADVAALTRRMRDSIVTVTQFGRDGGIHGTGTGFVVDADQGLIATNLHVTGEGRAISVELADGSEHEVTALHAWDRKLDLAVIRIDSKGLNLKAVPLADSDSLEQGQPVLAFGNPRGLKFSVVQGVASAMRDHMEDASGARVEFGFPMIQLAIPIEMGNSGGPVVDLQGRVHGVVTIKWLMTDNLGFAVPSNALKPLLDAPNPVPMNRWMTIGALDPGDWQPTMGANWSQRSGVIKVSGSGKGFGGRALCISKREVADAPYEVAADVRLDDESGAAGLAFACKSEGAEIHYGFYPSNGQLRLTRFEGPDVYSWTILDQVASDAYRPGEWNQLRVRVEEQTITGFVNGEKVVEVSDGVLRGGSVGLCKFRQTEAEFRHFRTGADLSPKVLPAEQLAKLEAQVARLAKGKPASPAMLDTLSSEPETSRALIAAQADELEQRAADLRAMTRQLHRRRVTKRMIEVLTVDEADIDLLEASLLIAWLDNPELDVSAYLEDFDRFAAAAADSLAEDKDDGDGLKRVEQLRDFLFAENGFHGSRSQYYHHSNSYLNEVLDDREGLPITLAVVFLELAQRTGIEGLSGLGLPGHFMVVYRPESTAEKDEDETEAESHFIDVFDGGRFVSRAEAEDLVRGITGSGIRPEHLESPSKQDIVLRMLRNLVGLEMDAGNPEVARPYIDLILDISPEEAGERFSRALLRYQAGEIEDAKRDLEWLIENRPPGIRIDRLQELYDQLPE